MTTKRTHGPCTCAFGTVHWVAPGQPRTVTEHAPDCPSLYPAQQEPDALTRLTRFLRSRVGHVLRDDETEQALALISAARAEMGALRNRAEKAEHAVNYAASIIEDAVGGGK